MPSSIPDGWWSLTTKPCTIVTLWFKRPPTREWGYREKVSIRPRSRRLVATDTAALNKLLKQHRETARVASICDIRERLWKQVCCYTCMSCSLFSYQTCPVRQTKDAPLVLVIQPVNNIRHAWWSECYQQSQRRARWNQGVSVLDFQNVSIWDGMSQHKQKTTSPH